jgi:hypothetical protein
MQPLNLLTSFLYASNASALSDPRIVHEFPNPTWLENIAATRNGSLLTGVLGATAALHLIDPFASAPPTANTTYGNKGQVDTLIHTFENADSVFGISELSPDVFAVATGYYSATTGPTQGSSSLWTVDLAPLSSALPPTVRKIADLKDAKVVNGIAALNANTVLLADSFGGTVLSVDVTTGEARVVSEDASLAPDFNASLPIGVNGMKVVGGYLYYTNTQTGVFRVRVDALSGVPTSSYERLATIDTADDVAVTDDGTVFVARPFAGLVERLNRDGSVAVAGDGGVLGGVTGVTLGRTWRDRNVVYACSFGGYTEDMKAHRSGGRIVAFEM